MDPRAGGDRPVVPLALRQEQERRNADRDEFRQNDTGSNVASKLV